MVSEVESQRFVAGGKIEKERYSNKPVVKALMASALGVGAIFAAAATGGRSGDIGILVALLGGVLLVAAWRNWEFGIQALLVVVIIEGAVRKWFLSSTWVYFYKDALFIAILLGYQTQRCKPQFLIKRRLNALHGVLIAFVLFVIAEAISPSLPHPLVGLLGIKAYILYIPLAFLIPRMFVTKEKLISFLKWYSLIALPVAFLGAMQFMDTNLNSPLNRYAWGEETAQAVANSTGQLQDVATFQDSLGGSYVRITSTFSYISGLSVYLPVAFALLLALLSLRSPDFMSGKIRWLYHIGIGAVIATSLMTGSRGAIVTLMIITVVFYCFTASRDLVRRVKQFAIGAVIVYITAMMLFPKALDAFYTRTFGGEAQVSEGQSRILEIFNLPFTEAAYAGISGYGAGATQNGVPALMKSLNLPFVGEEIPMRYEGESSRVMLDLGVIGYLLHASLRYILIITLGGVCLAIRDPESKILAIAVWAALLVPLVVGGAVVLHTQNVYQWFLVGIPLALLNAERLSDRARNLSIHRAGVHA